MRNYCWLLLSCAAVGLIGCGSQVGGGSSSEVAISGQRAGYDAIVITGRALNDKSSESVRRIWSEHFGWNVGVVKLDQLGKFDFSGIKVMYFPGGFYFGIHFPANAEANIRNAVANGMGYIGTCGGSMVAAETTGGGETMGLFPGEQPFGGGKGNRQYLFDTDHPIVANCSVRDQITSELTIHFNGGPATYIPNEDSAEGLVNWIVARGRRKNRPAITATLYGRGRVMLISPHPERPDSMGPNVAKAHQVIKMAAEWCAGISDPKEKESPTAKATIPSAADVGEELIFSAVGSSHPDNYPIGFVWDFGDGSPRAYTARARHAYKAPGPYPVRLTVTDGPKQSVRTAIVDIAGPKVDRPPVVLLLSPFTHNEISGSFDLKARAFDADAPGGIERMGVQLVGDDGPVFSELITGDRVGIRLDSAEFPDGPYTLTAIATSKVSAGGSSTETSIPLVIRNSPAPPKKAPMEVYKQLKSRSAESDEAKKQLEEFVRTHRVELLRAIGAGKGDQLTDKYGKPWNVASRAYWTTDENHRLFGGSYAGDAYIAAGYPHSDNVRFTGTIEHIFGHTPEISIWFGGSQKRTENDGYFVSVSVKGPKIHRKGKLVKKLPAPIIQQGKQYKLCVERTDGTIRAFLDDATEPVIEWTDPDPLTGPGHRAWGFYVWCGVVAISDYKVEELK